MQSSVRKILFSELSLWVLLAAFCCYALYPLRTSLRFGSDLVGGVYLTLAVQVEKAVEAELVTNMSSILQSLKKSGISVHSKQIADSAIVLNFDSVQDTQSAARLVKSEFATLQQETHNTQLRITFSKGQEERIKADAVQRNIEVLRLRLDQFSVAEIPIAAQGDRNIVIELPDVDPEQAKGLIGKAAQLEFRLVDKVAGTKEELIYEYDGDIPEDKEILPGQAEHGHRYYYMVQKYAQVTGRMLKNTQPALGGRTGVEPTVQFTLDQEGGNRFYDLTSKNVGRPLAIVLDGEVISAPTINQAIRNEGHITGNFSSDYAKTLSMLLKSGSFVAPVTFEEERQIGPALGQESRYKGLISCLIGLFLLLIFGFFFYGMSGLFAFIILLYNLVLVLVGLMWLKATLTLPGIAGMVLTVGMAIDASILIFERIKEELSGGNSLEKSVNVGFSNAMTVIIDANITTFIVGAVLYSFGSGPIQGFAVTMMLGIVSTLITGLFVLRALFKFVIRNFKVQRLSI